MDRDLKKDSAQRKADAAYERAHAGVRFKPGKPMAHLSPNSR